MGQVEQQAVVGASELNLSIAHANPYPPDVSADGEVPAGGQLFPCTPRDGSPTARRTQYLLQFQVTQGFQLAIRRIRLHLPIYLAETEVIKTTFKETTITVFKTEAEAKEAEEAKGGAPLRGERIKPISLSEPLEEETTETARGGTGKETIFTETVTLYKSVLPITIQVVAAVVGPEGTIWSDAFDVPISYQQGTERGKAIGTGLLDNYADLTNSLIIDPSKVYGLALFVRVPTTVAVVAAIGDELRNGQRVTLGATGEVVFFYDIEPRPVGK